jgi:ADP-heptose:LPS heptosyltransferase
MSDLTGHVRDFGDTAALLAQLDLVITVDTAVAHLAGALGKPTWVLLPFAPDWRWMLKRDNSIWYPSMQLFRLSEPGGWQEVMRRIIYLLKSRKSGTVGD